MSLTGLHAVVIEQRIRMGLSAVGHARNAAKEPEWTRRKTDVFTDAEVDAIGMLGECATATYLGVEVDEAVGRGGDGGTDLVWRGQRVAAKYNHRWRGYLMVEQRKDDDLAGGWLSDLTSDLIVLTHGKCDPPRRCHCREGGGVVVVVAGWLTKEEFMERCVLRDLGIGGRYICEVDQLHCMHEVWDAVPVVGVPL